jgi:hypothetical protein
MADITTGLVAYYPFNGNANDDSGNTNNGSVYGAVLATDEFGSANSSYSFNGSSSYIEVPSSTSLTSPIKSLTVASWLYIYPGWGSDGCADIVDFSNTGANGQYRFTICSNGYWSLVAGGFSYVSGLATDTWYHVAYSWNGKSVRYYIDGKLVTTASYSQPLQPTNMPLEIGRDPTGSLDYFAGQLDKIRIYKRALSGAEIKELYREGQVEGTSSGLSSIDVSCSDTTTGQEVTFASSGPWNCEKNGLNVNNQDQIGVTISGTAGNGTGQVKGSSSDLLPVNILCSDLTTGQQVAFPSSGPWNCEKKGLKVNSQDQISIKSSGTAQK